MILPSAPALVCLLLAAATGCGGPTDNAPVEPLPKSASKAIVEAEPVEFEVAAARVGEAVHLNIVGLGRGHREGGAFEDPTSWTIRARAGDASLQRVVNGSARVERAPVGSIDQNRWDVTVAYSVGFACPADATAIDVEVEAPGSVKFARRVELLPETSAGSR